MAIGQVEGMGNFENVVGTFPRGFSRNNNFAYPLVRADSLVSLNYGKGLVEKKRSPGDIPVYGTNGICGWHNEALVRGPGLILGRKGMGPLGVEWSESNFWVIDTAYYVTPNTPDLDLKFFYYLTKYVGLNHLKDGTSNPSLSRDTFSAQLLPFPSITEQKAIAHILGTLDDKIELNQQINQTLEAIARALFKSWFIDFDPVRAKLDGQQPVGMDAETAALFPDEFEDSAIGKIPKGWEAKRLKEIAINASEPFDFSSRSEVIFLNTGDVACGRLLHTNLISKTGLPGQAKKAIKQNDILYSEIRPGNRRYAFIDFAPDSFVVSTKFMVIRALDGIEPKLLYQVMTQDEVVSELQVIAESRSGTFPQITFDSISYLQFIVPPNHIQSAYLEVFDDLNSKVRNNDEQSKSLTEIRDRLLPKLLSGEIRIKDAEEIVETVV